MNHREIDKLVAEHVFGLEIFEFTSGDNPPELWTHGKNDDDSDDNLWHYSTSIADAWAVRDAMAKRIFSKRQMFTESCRKLISDKMECDEGIHHSEVILRITPEIICLAALSALGMKVE